MKVPGPEDFRLEPQVSLGAIWREAGADPFSPPGGRPVHYAFSGGRTSAYLVTQVIRHAGGRLPHGGTVIFCNTGAEREKTLEFVARCADWWQTEIVWLEYRHRRGERPAQTFERVSFDTASRNKQPFDALLHNRRSLPSPAQRHCTVEMKIRTAERYLASVDPPGLRRETAIGYRYDEPSRWTKAVYEECRPWLPLVFARVREHEILRFWAEEAPFDLGLPPGWGNCDYCFFKPPAVLREMHAAEPGGIDWWIDGEDLGATWSAERGTSRPESTRWRREYSYREIVSGKPLPLLEETGTDPGSAGCYCTA